MAGIRVRGAGAHRRDRLVIALAVLLAAALAVAAASSIVAVRNHDKAASAQRLLTSRRLAASALAEMSRSPERALLLALEGYARVADAPAGDAYEAHNALLLAFERNARLKAVIRGPDGQAQAIEFSPDGKTIAVATGDGNRSAIRLWDVKRRTPIGKTIRTDWTEEIQFSTDGRTLLSSSGHGSLYALDPERGVNRHKPFSILPFVDVPSGRFWDDPGGTAFSANGRVVVTGGPHGALTVWGVATGRPLLSVNIGDPLGVGWSVSPDGRVLAVSQYGKVSLWDLARGKEVHGPTVAATSTEFSPDSRTLALGTGHGVVLWDLARHRADRPLLRTPIGATGSLAFSADGRRLASTGSEGRVVLWNLARTGPVPRRLRGRGVEWLEFSPDSHTLALWRTSGTTFVDVATRKPLPNPISFPRPQGTDAYTLFAFSPDGKTVASAADDGAIRLWDLSRAVPLERLALQTPDPAACCEAADSLAFSPDGRTLASGGAAGRIALWDAEQGAAFGVLIPSDARQVAFSPDGRTLAGLSESSGIELWDVRREAQLGTLPRHGIGHEKDGVFSVDIWLHDIAFSPDGGTIASSDGRSIRLFTLPEGTAAGSIRGVGDDAGDELAYSPDGKLLVSAPLINGNLQLYDVARQAPIGGPLSTERAPSTSPSARTVARSHPPAPTGPCGSGRSRGTPLLRGCRSAGTAAR